MSKTRKRRGGGWFSINPNVYTSPSTRAKVQKDAASAMNLLRKYRYDSEELEEIKNTAKENIIASSKNKFFRKKTVELREELRNIEKEKEHIYRAKERGELLY